MDWLSQPSNNYRETIVCVRFEKITFCNNDTTFVIDFSLISIKIVWRVWYHWDLALSEKKIFFKANQISKAIQFHFDLESNQSIICIRFLHLNALRQTKMASVQETTKIITQIVHEYIEDDGTDVSVFWLTYFLSIFTTKLIKNLISLKSKHDLGYFSFPKREKRLSDPIIR